MPIKHRRPKAVRPRRSLRIEQLEARTYLSAMAGGTAGLNPIHSAALGALPLDQTFQLASQPDATKTIYLDFNGHTTRNTPWNRKVGKSELVSAAWSLDADRTTWSAAERRAIQQIWAAVAEDYAPFDVNVTTKYSTSADLTRTNRHDQRWGIRVVIGTDPGITNGSLGIAYIGSFNWSTDTPAFVFTTDPNHTALAISHEVGHTLGLHHDGVGLQPYFSGADGWGPIMGNPLSQAVTQWSRGGYTAATNSEDDVHAIATGNGFGFRHDDVGDNLATATELPATTTSTVSGVIERASDQDWYRFDADRGSVVITATTLSFGANLNTHLQLLDSRGEVLAHADPANSLDSRIDFTISEPGTYYVAVEGAALTPAQTHTDYGSLGHYRLSVTRTLAASSNTTLSLARAAAHGPAPPLAPQVVAEENLSVLSYSNRQPRMIRASAPSTISSSIRVDHQAAAVRKVEVEVDIRHRWIGDLEVSLISPSGRRVPLVLRRGGRRDQMTVTFTDDADRSVRAAATLIGTFRPESPLASLNGEPAAGEWQLVVRDRAYRDGGYLKGWSLRLTTTREPAASQTASAMLAPSSPRHGPRHMTEVPPTEAFERPVHTRRHPRAHEHQAGRRLSARDAALAALTKAAARVGAVRYWEFNDASICSRSRGT